MNLSSFSVGDVRRRCGTRGISSESERSLFWKLSGLSCASLFFPGVSSFTNCEGVGCNSGIGMSPEEEEEEEEEIL